MRLGAISGFLEGLGKECCVVVTEWIWNRDKMLLAIDLRRD